MNKGILALIIFMITMITIISVAVSLTINTVEHSESTASITVITITKSNCITIEGNTIPITNFLKGSYSVTWYGNGTSVWCKI